MENVEFKHLEEAIIKRNSKNETIQRNQNQNESRHDKFGHSNFSNFRPFWLQD